MGGTPDTPLNTDEHVSTDDQANGTETVAEVEAAPADDEATDNEATDEEATEEVDEIEEDEEIDE